VEFDQCFIREIRPHPFHPCSFEIDFVSVVLRGGLRVLYSLELGTGLLLNFGHHEHKEGTKFTTWNSTGVLSVKSVASVSSVFF
jgi:hypothetical protein